MEAVAEFIRYLDKIDSIGLFYDVEKNIFLDEDGQVVKNIFELITPNDLYLFRHLEKEYVVFRHRFLKNVVCEIYMPTEEPCYC
jgi:hypothetical protein